MTVQLPSEKKICGHELGAQLIYYYKKNAHQTLMQLIYKSESYRQQRKLHCSFVRSPAQRTLLMYNVGMKLLYE